MRIPERRSLSSETADVLREGIAHGRWGGHLPGERVLAEQLHVGRDTIRAALRQLATAGHVAKPSHGQRRQVAKRARKTATREPKLAMLSPVKLAELPPQVLLAVDAMREHLAKNGWQFEVLSPGIFHLARPARLLAEFTGGVQASAWLLYQCHEPVQEWFQQSGLPCLIWGSPLPGIELPNLDTDWEAAAFHAGGLLRRNNHRRVMLLAPERMLAGNFAAARGLQRAFDGVAEANITIVRDTGTRDGLARILGQTMRADNRPTAVVAMRAKQALTLLTWIAGSGLSVPRDLSFISLADELWFAEVVPEVMRYRTNLRTLTATLLRRIGELTKEGRVARASQLIVPDHVTGSSVARL